MHFSGFFESTCASKKSLNRIKRRFSIKFDLISLQSLLAIHSGREIKTKQKIEDFEMKIDIYIDILTVVIDSAGNFTAIMTLALFLIRLNDREKFFFSTVQLLTSKNDFSGGKAPEKINLGNNCPPYTLPRGMAAV